MLPNNTTLMSGAAAYSLDDLFLPAFVLVDGSMHLVGTGPSFWVLTPQSSFGANKFQFVLYNNDTDWVVRIHLVVMIPGKSTVSGALPTEWTLRRRDAPTTAPSGTGALSLEPMDTGVWPSPTLTGFNVPGTAPAGGTLTDVLPFIPQADEQKLTTLDAPTMSGLQPFVGVTLYNAATLWPVTPLTLRKNQTLEIQQSATGGTGNCRILCVGRLEWGQ